MPRHLRVLLGNSHYSTFEGGIKEAVRRQRGSAGGAQYVRGESVEKLYSRARENLEQGRRELRR